MQQHPLRPRIHIQILKSSLIFSLPFPLNIYTTISQRGGEQWWIYTGTQSVDVYVVVNFLSQVIFIFLLFLGMVIYANEVETKEK